MNRHVALVALLSGAALAESKPAAVQLCLELPKEVPLFVGRAQPNYRALGDGTFILDFDVTLAGRAPERLSKATPSCFRAWLPARHVKRIAFDFARTDLNLPAVEKDVDLKLKADLWYDGGAFAVAQAPWSKVGTALPGELLVDRVGRDGAVVPIEDKAALPRGRYVVRYTAPTHPCDLTVRGVATGTVREDNQPALVKELVDTYRKDWAPDVAKDLKLACGPAEALALVVRIVDGAYFKPLAPQVQKVTLPERLPRYRLVVNGVARDFTPGDAVDVGFDETLVLEEGAAPAPAVAASGS